jgi:hypothetical protein
MLGATGLLTCMMQGAAYRRGRPPPCWPTLGCRYVIVGHSERRSGSWRDRRGRAKPEGAARARGGFDPDHLPRRKPGASVKPERLRPSAPVSCAPQCPMPLPAEWWWLMSRSGRSAPARPPVHRTPKPSTKRCARPVRAEMARRCAFFTAVQSSRVTPPPSCRRKMSTAPWSGGRAWMREASQRSCAQLSKAFFNFSMHALRLSDRPADGGQGGA